MSPSHSPVNHTPDPPPSYNSERLSRWFTRARRTGFFAALTPEAWHTLAAVLSFQSGDGRLSFSEEQLALTLGQQKEEGKRRLAALAEIRWEELPLITPEYFLHGELAGVRLIPNRLFEPFTASRSEMAAPAARSGSGQLPPELHAKLEALQLTPGQIERLAAHHTVEQIQQQLEWLPARSPRNPAAMLVRAIEEDWEQPRSLEADRTLTIAAASDPAAQAPGSEETS